MKKTILNLDFKKILQDHVSLAKNSISANDLFPLLDNLLELSENDIKYLCLSNILHDEKYGFDNFLGFLLLNTDKTTAKKIKQIFREKEEIDVSVDDIIKVLPAGGCDIVKERVRKY